MILLGFFEVQSEIFDSVEDIEEVEDTEVELSLLDDCISVVLVFVGINVLLVIELIVVIVELLGVVKSDTVEVLEDPWIWSLLSEEQEVTWSI